MSLPPGTVLGHYQIVAPLGAGGMGEVFRATDTKLGRDVALKVLPADLARDADRLGRFQREARAVAALNHPNIVTIHSVEEIDAIHFFTMELVEGHSLDRVIAKNSLSADRVLVMAAAIADALAAAHDKGIVHRDLKPANVMETADGRIKVLDFGLAKVADAGEAMATALQTREGVAMGTVPYMSPEQVAGRPIDHRTDLFSLGVMLYELVAGRRPFEGASSIELASAILRDTPRPLSDARATVPPGLARLIQRCLEKDRSQRVISAREIANECRSLARDAVPSVPAPAPVVPPSPIGSGSVRQDEGFWVAVLPFRYGSGNADLAALADGLSEEIVTGLSRFSYLRVVSRGTTLKYASQAADARIVGREIGARYVMEGSLRHAGTQLRVAVQLTDAATGAHLWAETYDRRFHPDQLFAMQDELVPRIVSTCADAFGVLAGSISDAVRSKPVNQLTPYEAVMRGFGYHRRLSPSEHAEARDALERAVEQAPGNADCWAMLSWVYSHEHGHGFNPQPGSLDRALTAARRAVDLAPSNHLAQQALAVALFFRKETAACLSAAERALALNPLDGSNEAIFLITFTGDWDRGCALIARAMELNPHHPAWYRAMFAFNEYRKGNYRGAVEQIVACNLPEFFWANALLAAGHAQLGELDAAGKALRDLLAQKPEFRTSLRDIIGRWFNGPLAEHFADGLRRAGLADDQPAAGRTISAANSVVTPPGAEGFWIVVRSFKHSGGAADLAELAEGLADGIVAGLSRFSYLRVIARGADETAARYVMDGSLRQAGARLRLAIQLVDRTTGAHLWAENYERTFAPDALFDLQDELVPPIVSTVADLHGVLPRSMSAVVRSKPPDQLTPYEAVLRSFAYFERVTAEELGLARIGLDAAVQKAPDYADAWALLALLCVQDHAQGFKLGPDSLARGVAAARRAVEAGPSNHLALFALAQALYFERDLEAFRIAAERAAERNPMDSNSLTLLGELLVYAGQTERGLALAARARQLNPHHPGWYWYADFFSRYWSGDYRGALSYALKFNMPNHWGAQAVTAAVCGQLGEREGAARAVANLLRIRPGIATTIRADLEMWWTRERAEHVIDGLRKAGLEIDRSPEHCARAESKDAMAAKDAKDSGAARADDGFWVAVLPFKNASANPEIAALADGLSEAIVSGLSRFSYLRVIARSSTERYAREPADVRSIGRQIGARYVLDGSVRQAGTQLRVVVQLTDAESGAHLWAETYQRPFKPDSIFELQDDLVPLVVSTVADWYGVLPRSMSEAVRRKPADTLSPYEALLRAFGYFERVTPEEHAAVRQVLERAVEQTPDDAAAWAMLSMMYGEEYRFGWNVRPDSLGRSLQAARRAADAAPTSHVSHLALAQAHYFRKEIDAFRNAAERAVSLNAMDGSAIEYLSHLLAFAGDWQRGCQLGERARLLNPNHPAWYWALPFLDAYRRRDYEAARALEPKAYMPGQHFSLALFAALHGQLGDRDRAAATVRELLTLKPDFADIARELFGKWYPAELVEHLIDGLRKAGLEVDRSPEDRTRSQSKDAQETKDAQDSGAARADEGFWVAVLPFKSASANADVAALADGVSEAIVSGLSRFAYLRVIARSSTARYARDPADVRTVGREIGARYVMEGTLRLAGSQLRVAVQLIDTATGANLWAHEYQRAFDAGDVFALQDDLVPRIVSTVADAYGVLPRSMSQAVRSKPLGALTAYEALLRSLSYAERVTPEEHAQAKAAVKHALEQSPGHSDCWAMLSIMLSDDYGHGFGAPPETLDGAVKAARRSVDADPSNHRAYQALAWALFLRKEFQASRQAGDRALALNPMDACTAVYVGQTRAFSGDWDGGCALVAQAIALNPHHPGWYWYASFLNAYRQRDYREALAIALKMNLPGVSLVDVALAATHAQLGEREPARRCLNDLLSLRPDYANVARRELAKWFDAAIVEHLIDGLRKAGLETGPSSEQDADPAAKGAKEAKEVVAIAVLPFDDMSAARDQQYLCEGMAEEIRNALVPIRGIRVASRTSTFRARHDHGDLPAVARALSVNHILEGSVRTAGNRLRVTAQLTDVGNGYQVWSNRFDREAADVFAIQDDIAAGVVEAVKSRLAPGAHVAHTRAKTDNLEAYRSYLKGRHLRGKEDYAAAFHAFDEAVRLDPSHAPSWTGLAEITVLSSVFGMILPREACRAARSALKTAASLQGASADGWHVEAFACWIERRWEAAEIAWRRALEIEPRHVLALGSFGLVLCSRQRFEEAVPVLERTRDADPLASFPYALTGLGYLNCGRLPEAERQLEDALSFEQDDITALYCLAIAKVALGRVADGIGLAERAVTLSHRGAFLVGILGWALASADRTSEARALLEELRTRPAGSPTVVAEAWLLGALGEIDAAFEVLGRAEEECQANLYFTGLPTLDPLRGDPRFTALLGRLGLPAA